MSISGLLFDIDGTMVDTDPAHFAAFNAVLEGHRAPITFDEYSLNIQGFAENLILDYLFPGGDAPAGLIDDKEARFRAEVTTLEPTPGLVDLLEWAAKTDMPYAAVTNAPRANAEVMLSALSLRERFASVTIGEELPNPKPHPMPYLNAAAEIGIDPGAAVAFEDSLSGIISARAAGAHVYAIACAIPAERQLEAGAARVITDFNDPALLAHLQAA